ncbi:MAG: hypothetical protein Q4P06_03460 [Actinomycetaceae bacterium]|nr:hypothetical protein [Actinomycetaceae bacterium]
MLRLPVWAGNRERTRVPVVVLAEGTTPPTTWEGCLRHCPEHPIYVLGAPRRDNGEITIANYLYAVDHTLSSLGLNKVILMGVGTGAGMSLALAAVEATAKPDRGNLPAELRGQTKFDDTSRVGALILAGPSLDSPTLAERAQLFTDAIHLLSADSASRALVIERYLAEGSLTLGEVRAAVSATPVPAGGTEANASEARTGVEVATPGQTEPPTASALQWQRKELFDKWVAETDPAAASTWLHLRSRHPDLLEVASRVEIPVALLQGSHDGSFSPQASQKLAQALCTSTHTVPRAATLMQVDAPERLAQAIRQLAPFVAGGISC